MTYRYIILTYNQCWRPDDRPTLLNTARSLISEDMKVIDCRVASKHVEFDVLSRDGDIKGFLSRLASIFTIQEVKEVVRAEELRAPREVLNEAVRMFNAERYWEAHEILEGLWHRLEGREKKLIQSIILLAAAYVHLQKGEIQTYRSILSKARAWMDGANQIYGLDLGPLKRGLDRIKAGFSNELVKINLS
jgi:hypothetical protein